MAAAPSSPRPAGRPLVLPLARAGAVLLACSTVACIISDTFIDVRVGGQNEQAVRIIEGIPLDIAAREACDATNFECPMPPGTGLPTYLDPSDPSYQFCLCGEDNIDDNRLNAVVLFAEDADEDEGAASDSLYAALLLDWSPTSGDSAFDYVAYRNYVDSRVPLDQYFSPYETGVIKRPRPHLRSLSLVDESGHFDLCNGSGTELSPGTHTLTLIVTDRSWYQTEPAIIGDTGGTAETGAGETGAPIETMAIVLEGVPDIASGATYDIETYVFSCLEEGQEGCDCVEAEENP